MNLYEHQEKIRKEFRNERKADIIFRVIIVFVGIVAVFIGAWNNA